MEPNITLQDSDRNLKGIGNIPDVQYYTLDVWLIIIA